MKKGGRGNYDWTSKKSDMGNPWEGSWWRHQEPWFLQFHWMGPGFPITVPSRYWFSGAKGMKHEVVRSAQVRALPENEGDCGYGDMSQQLTLQPIPLSPGLELVSGP